MKKTSVFIKLLRYAWENHKALLFIVIFKSIFSAVLPLINVWGIGLIIDALINGYSNKSVMNIILVFIALNLSTSLMKHIFTYLENVESRKASDKIQLEYMRDGVIINYHWAQDGSVLDMKKKSMGANPVFLFPHIGGFIDYILKFTGILFIFSRLSPMFIFIIAATSAVSVILTFKTRQIDYMFENDRAEDYRKRDYLYNVMTQYEYAKKIRINNLKPLILHKYSGIIKIQLEKLKSFIRQKLCLESLSSVTAVIQSAIMYIYFSYSVFTGKLTITEYSVLLGAVALLTSILIGFFDNIAVIGRLTDRMDLFLSYKKWVHENSDIFATNERPVINIDEKRNEIQFINVSFKYPDTETPVLSNFNFTIKDGQKIGIVGLNGS